MLGTVKPICIIGNESEWKENEAKFENSGNAYCDYFLFAPSKHITMDILLIVIELDLEFYYDY
jgi:hypothetical protein